LRDDAFLDWLRFAIWVSVASWPTALGAFAIAAVIARLSRGYLDGRQSGRKGLLNTVCIGGQQSILC
jgi:hypothetical protein